MERIPPSSPDSTPRPTAVDISQTPELSSQRKPSRFSPRAKVAALALPTALAFNTITQDEIASFASDFRVSITESISPGNSVPKEIKQLEKNIPGERTPEELTRIVENLEESGQPIPGNFSFGLKASLLTKEGEITYGGKTFRLIHTADGVSHYVALDNEEIAPQLIGASSSDSVEEAQKVGYGPALIRALDNLNTLEQRFSMLSE